MEPADSHAMRLLVVEDDPGMAALLERALGRVGYAVDTVGDGDTALARALRDSYDAVVLDVMIPPPDGFEVCRLMRAAGRWDPVLMLTARDAVADRVRGLDAGADDYLVKPFTFDELYARLRAVTRRRHRERPALLRIGDLTLDPVARQVRRGAVEIGLSPREFTLLQTLMSQPDRVLTRLELLGEVWDMALVDDTNAVDRYVAYLRGKIDVPFGRHNIEVVVGQGYRFRSDA